MTNAHVTQCTFLLSLWRWEKKKTFGESNIGSWWPECMYVHYYTVRRIRYAVGKVWLCECVRACARAHCRMRQHVWRCCKNDTVSLPPSKSGPVSSPRSGLIGPSLCVKYANPCLVDSTVVTTNPFSRRAPNHFKAVPMTICKLLLLLHLLLLLSLKAQNIWVKKRTTW